MNPVDAPAEALVSVELLRVSMPLLSVHRSAKAVARTRESIIVRVTDASASIGISECPTLGASGYATETTDEAWEALASRLAPAWLAGQRVAVPAAPAAGAAMADASLDAALRARGRSLAEHLMVMGSTAGASRTPGGSLRWCAVIADVALTAAEARDAAVEALQAGASMLKYKFTDPSRLREVVEAVRQATAVPIAADANGTLDPGAAVEVDDLGLCYLEQPLPHNTRWDELAALADTLVTPVCLDESLRSPDALMDAIAAGALDVASIKAPRMGGVLNAATAVRLCGEKGVDCFVGGMFEAGIGRATALAVASMAGCTVPTDLGPSARYFARDLCDPLVTDRAGHLVVPVGAGIGRDIDEQALDDHLVDRLLFER